MYTLTLETSETYVKQKVSNANYIQGVLRNMTVGK